MTHTVSYEKCYHAILKQPVVQHFDSSTRVSLQPCFVILGTKQKKAKYEWIGSEEDRDEVNQ